MVFAISFGINRFQARDGPVVVLGVRADGHFVVVDLPNNAPRSCVFFITAATFGARASSYTTKRDMTAWARS
jgi:hypothetical protein